MFFAGSNIAERAPNARAKSRGSEGKSPKNVLKFSFLKSLKMHQILKTRKLIYTPPVQGCFVQLRTWLECGSHRFLWQHTASRRDYKPQNSTTTPQGNSSHSTGFYYQQDSLKILVTNSHFSNPKSHFRHQ